MTSEGYEEQRKKVVIPAYNRIKEIFLNGGYYQPLVSYGYFRCYAKKDDLIILDESGNNLSEFNFPRQKQDKGLCIADYFRNKPGDSENNLDVIGVMAVTLGDDIVNKLNGMYSLDKYSDYYLLHGLAVEVADALAEEVHRRMRVELGIDRELEEDAGNTAIQPYQGSRYSFGYPACPNLKDNEKLLKLAKAEEIGIKLTEKYQMEPEFSVSALVVHHAQARYFRV
ncbi:MAG: vitamin B12 dependent-methionine synthase activation domain-containing protein [bacterium]